MAINWDTLKQRYLQSDRTSQLESITLNLARIQALANSEDDSQVARHLVRESQFFIEWTVPTIDLDKDLSIATELNPVQDENLSFLISSQSRHVIAKALVVKHGLDRPEEKLQVSC